MVTATVEAIESDTGRRAACHNPLNGKYVDEPQYLVT